MMAKPTHSATSTPAEPLFTGLLREDLKLYPAPFDRESGPAWTVHDPLRNRFFRLGWLDKTLFTHWNNGKVAAIIQQVRQQAGQQVTQQQVEQMHRFLSQNNLLVAADAPSARTLWRRRQSTTPSTGLKLLHHALFFKIPLLHPDPLLRRLLPWVNFIYSRTFLLVLGLLGLGGLYLSAREWDRFQASFHFILSPHGAMWYLGALLLVKIVHELGHALTACRLGCRIPTMGVAFMVFFPLLYTDTSEAWKLNNHRARMAIGMAGVAAELMVALLATLLAHFLAPGAPRDSLIFLATVTWITSLVINASPFMRFDGYYLLADYLGMDNLQERAFALGRWQLRAWLLGVKTPPPEAFSPRRRWLLLGYAYATWLYRLLLFFGIALLVYHLLFKLAGLVMMAVELIWFIARPIWRELQGWWRIRSSLAWTIHTLTTLLAVVGLMLFVLVPWQGEITLPGLKTSSQQLQLYPPASSRLRHVAIKRGDRVAAGELLLVLESPDLKQKTGQIDARIAALEWKLNQAHTQPILLENSAIMQREMAGLLTEREGLGQQADKLTITAPFDGMITDIMPGLHPGRWLSAHDPVITLVDLQTVHLEGLIAEADIQRLSLQSIGTFQPHLFQEPATEVRLTAIAPAAISALKKPYFAAHLGGEVPVWQDGRGALIPYESFYRLTFQSLSPLPTLRHEQPGRITLPVEKRSLLNQLTTTVAQVFIRESGF
ncbi:MAG: HlyD family efflux transporter periplasmic adaptor subunit [Magnetococcales bacterium]|nr:HlyD family efflux transporter periplasmic adaptor subunit [Magnetococcales bacterium]